MREKLTKYCPDCSKPLIDRRRMRCQPCAVKFRIIPLIERFEKKIKKTPTCWLWTGFRNHGGYGKFSINHACKLAHRVAWEIKKGNIPEGKLILHHCDNPPCVRIDHLFIGDHIDNAVDCALKMRDTKFRKLTNKEIEQIRMAYKFRDPLNNSIALAKKYGTCFQNIHLIVKRKTWKHII